MSETGPGSTDVLVVGAGPAGLTLAIQARLARARVRVVERRLEPRAWAPALAIHPRTLEVLRGLGVAEAVLDRGISRPSLQVHLGRTVAAGILHDLPLPETEYPFVAFVPQPEVESALRDRLAGLGVDIEWGSEFAGMEEGGEGVVARIRDPGGSRQISARYLAGCDGADSSVRHHLGIRFRGRRYRQTIVVADAEAATDLDPGTAHAFLTRAGIVFLFPLGGGLWRVIAPRPTGDDVGTDLAALVRRHTAGEVHLDSVAWQKAIRPQHRLASRYHQGHAFLVGDAAHVHSPAGAQGMNTGIQDAVDLGWKLGLVVQGATEALLDTYEVERRAVARHVIALTGAAFALEVSDVAWLRIGRRLAAPSIAGLLLPRPRLIASVARLVSGLDTRYRGGAIAETGGVCRREGRRLPDRLLDHPDAARLHRLLDATRFHLLVYGTPVGAELSGMLSPYADVLRIHRIQERAAGLRGSRPVFDLVRPDGYVAVSGRESELAAVLRYLDRWVGALRKAPTSASRLDGARLADRGAQRG